MPSCLNLDSATLKCVCQLEVRLALLLRETRLMTLKQQGLFSADVLTYSFKRLSVIMAATHDELQTATGDEKKTGPSRS